MRFTSFMLCVTASAEQAAVPYYGPRLEVHLKDTTEGMPCFKNDFVQLKRNTEFPFGTVYAPVWPAHDPETGEMLCKEQFPESELWLSELMPCVEGDFGVVADNLGAFGEAPLNIYFEKDPEKKIYQLSYRDLTDVSCRTFDDGPDDPYCKGVLKHGDTDPIYFNDGQMGGRVYSKGMTGPKLGLNAGSTATQFGGSVRYNKECCGKSIGIFKGKGKKNHWLPNRCTRQHVPPTPAGKQAKGKKGGGKGQHLVCERGSEQCSVRDPNALKRWPRYSAFDEFHYPK